MLRSSDDLQLGAKADSHNASGGFFRGAMHDLMIFDEPFSLERAAAIHAAGPGGDLSQYAWMSSLVAGYHLDEHRGTTVHDFSGHGNDGTLHGGVSWSPAASAPHAHALQFDGTRYPHAAEVPEIHLGRFHGLAVVQSQEGR